MPYVALSFPNQPRPERPLPELIDDEEEYEIEEIVKQRDKVVGHGQNHQTITEYLVKWKGYPMEENSWVKHSNMANAEELVNEYEARIHALPYTPSSPSESNSDKVLAPVINADGSDTGHGNRAISTTSSFRKLVVDISKQMDKALQEENEKWLWENNVPPDNFWKYKPPKSDPRFNNPKVRDSYLHHHAKEIQESHHEQRPYIDPPILLDPPSEDDNSDVNQL
ncbi:uncharacterized protein EV420DRAFT_1649447 [Desarmillaria tabescens]|uniref:Chromo domain-containing protein n=1 Tax=Armillaria tabescens TaxID=1929756 RepID=A0AA39JIF9_ARMTA|nr:uncharacterized protein EV420DRAFT_1649447 [Desarmillaria tabescens]KAK0443024.1 hypothetical protein EV420DRAFT_1649447 [Desarmillaria tabescens]